MPKAASANAPQEEKQVSKAAFLKSLDKQKETAREAAKTKRQEGFLSDLETLEKLGIAPNMSVTFPGTVSNIKFSFAKDDANRPAFRFNYVVHSDNPKKNGTIVGTYHILEEGVGKDDGKIFRTKEQAQAILFGEFQGLGEDTEAWAADPRKNPLHFAVDAAEQHTKDKTPVLITVKHWVKGQKSGMNVFVKPALADEDNSDLDASEDEETYEDVEGDEGDAFDPDVWINGFVTFDSTVEPGTTIFGQVQSFDEATGTFTILDEANETWEGEYAIPADAVTWADKQAWE